MMTQPPHILIVDDHRDIRDALVKCADKLNIAVVDALESHNTMADQALRHEKVFKGLANLLVGEVYRQLRESL